MHVSYRIRFAWTVVFLFAHSCVVYLDNDVRKMGTVVQIIWTASFNKNDTMNSYLIWTALSKVFHLNLEYSLHRWYATSEILTCVLLPDRRWRPFQLLPPDAAIDDFYRPPLHRYWSAILFSIFCYNGLSSLI